MTSSVLSKGHLVKRLHLFTSTPLHCQSRSASINSAIGRGLRRSQGVGFRGREKDFGGRRDFDGPRDRDRDIVRRTSEVRPDLPPSQLTREGWRSSKYEEPLPKKRETPRSLRRKEFFAAQDSDEKSRSRRARFYDVDSSHGRGSRNKPALSEPSSRSPASSKFLPHKSHDPDRARRAAESDLMAIQRNPQGSKISASRRAFLEKASGKRQQHDVDDSRYASPRSDNTWGQVDSSYGKSNAVRRDSYEGRPDGLSYGTGLEFSREDKKPFRNAEPKETYGKSGDWSARRNNFGSPRDKWSDTLGSRDDEHSYSKPANPFLDEQNLNDERPRFKKSFDKNIPLSIPYTTPASEFLYGTSVVETALSSKKEPRRKLYKLYIYSGGNRENLDRDNSIERLARKAGVEVTHMSADSIRLMDKMSGGRPHNGYILEASPLPRLPVIGLGSVTSGEDDMGQYDGKHQSANKDGFAVSLDYQSREEAEINGTYPFVQVPRDPTGRKPFVLLLDSILDPGNLGGIIRSASFLGVSAIAISTRNSASFTPVVMKASAGASESVTILSVSKPAGFLKNSKAAGWTIYAAVPPSSGKPSNYPPHTTTDELANPLAEGPCILVLGNEGEGLRWNLRGQADWDISIPGIARGGAVDSLNVSVAAGLLCNAFLRNRHDGGFSTVKKHVDTFMRPERDLF